MKRVCPECGEEVEPEHFACRMGSKGGKAGTGASKARTTEQARAAASCQWHPKKVKSISVPSLSPVVSEV